MDDGNGMFGNDGFAADQGGTSNDVSLDTRELEILDLSGLGEYEFEALTLNASGTGYDGVLVTLDGRGMVVDRYEFDQIEGFLDDQSDKPRVIVDMLAVEQGQQIALEMIDAATFQSGTRMFTAHASDGAVIVKSPTVVLFKSEDDFVGVTRITYGVSDAKGMSKRCDVNILVTSAEHHEISPPMIEDPQHEVKGPAAQVRESVTLDDESAAHLRYIEALELNASGVDHVTFTDETRVGGVVTFRDGISMTLDEIESVTPCFTPGSTIATPRGEKRVEELKAGDRVITRDNGIQEIRWAGRKDFTGTAFQGSPHLRPVLIKAGSLGNGLPERDMYVSPNHRMLISNERTLEYFNEQEVLVAAKDMVGADGIHTVDAMRVTYIHFLFDRHEVILSNGSWTESFQPAQNSLSGIGAEQRSEIINIFPELATPQGNRGFVPVRKTLNVGQAKLLVDE